MWPAADRGGSQYRFAGGYSRSWVYAIYLTTGIQIPFPVIADRMADIAKLYGMIAPDVSKQETVRNVFFIDPNQIIRAILTYPLTNGRSIPEILRLLTALQTTDSDHGYNTQHILNKPAVKSARPGARDGKPVTVDKQQLAFGRCDYTDRKRFYFRAGKGFPKQISDVNFSEDASVSVIVVLYDLNLSR